MRVFALISWIVGKLMDVSIPRSLRGPVLTLFARIVGASPEEAQHPLSHYRSVGDFFTRALTAHARPIGVGVVSPVDGMLRQCGDIQSSTITNVKGHQYTVRALIGDAQEAERYASGSFVNLYLAPKNYHRVHAPCAGRIVHVRVIPGSLLPVNSLGVFLQPNFQVHNERVVITMETDHGRVVVVMVGALNVGKMSLAFDSLCTNTTPITGTAPYSKTFNPPLACEKGAELGTFHLGSSVVLVFEQKLCFMHRPAPIPVRMGESLVE